MGGNKIICRSMVFCALLFGCSVLAPLQADAKVFVVNSAEDASVACASSCTLRGAIEEANTNNETDVILVDSSISSIKLTTELILDSVHSSEGLFDIAIAGNVVIDGNRKTRVFSVAQGTKAYMRGLSITGGFIHDYKNGEGAGIHNSGELTLYHVAVYSNYVKGHAKDSQKSYVRGAGIFNGGGAKLSIVRSNIGPRNVLDAKGQSAKALGAGVYNAGTLSVERSNIFYNQSYTTASGVDGAAESLGGGMYLAGKIPAHIVESSLYSNTVRSEIVESGFRAKAQGAGIYTMPWVEMYMTNSTVSANKAISYGNTGPKSLTYAHGGAIFTGAYSKLYFANVTMAKNKVETPSSLIPEGTAVGHSLFGVIMPASEVVFKNSIIESEGKNCNHALDSAGNNIVSDSSCVLTEPGDAQNMVAGITPLSNYGGFTLLHGLESNAAAINAGNPDGCTDFSGHLLSKDQRGKYRPQVGCDVGAYEL